MWAKGRWATPNTVPGRFGPRTTRTTRTKESFEYVHLFARGLRPHFDLNAVRVPPRHRPRRMITHLNSRRSLAS